MTTGGHFSTYIISPKGYRKFVLLLSPKLEGKTHHRAKLQPVYMPVSSTHNTVKCSSSSSNTAAKLTLASILTTAVRTLTLNLAYHSMLKFIKMEKSLKRM